MSAQVVPRSYRPELYSLIGRVMLEGVMTTIYVTITILLEMWHMHDEDKLPIYVIPFIEAALQLIILYAFFPYGVGYMNPITVFSVMFIDILRGEHGRGKTVDADSITHAVEAHHIDFIITCMLVAAEIVGSIVAVAIVLAVSYNTIGGEYGYVEVDYGTLRWHQWFILWSITGMFTMLPKLMAAVKRHTIAANVAFMVAGAYIIAATFGHRNILVWLVTAFMSNVGGHSWASMEASDGLLVFLAQIQSGVLGIIFVVCLPKKIIGRQDEPEKSD